MTHHSDIFTSHEDEPFVGKSHAIFTSLLNVIIVPDKQKVTKAAKRSGKAKIEILQELYSNKNGQQPHPRRLSPREILSIYRPNHELIYLFRILREQGINICLFTDRTREDIYDLLSGFQIDPNIFNAMFFAGEKGMQKTDAILFLNLIAASLNAGDTVNSIYIDDNAENCLKASSLPTDTSVAGKYKHSLGIQFDLFSSVEDNNKAIADGIRSHWAIPPDQLGRMTR